MLSKHTPNSNGMITIIPPTDLLCQRGFDNYIKEFSQYNHYIGFNFSIITKNFKDKKTILTIENDLFALLNEKPVVKVDGYELNFVFAYDVDPLQIPNIAVDICEYCYSNNFRPSFFFLFT